MRLWLMILFDVWVALPWCIALPIVSVRVRSLSARERNTVNYRQHRALTHQGRAHFPPARGSY